jgi:hypothetical protein
MNSEQLPMNVNEEGKKEEPILHCGTSLAESEHCCKTFPPTETSTTDLKHATTIDALRSSLANDIVSNNGSYYSTFTSPFTVPTQGEHLLDKSDNRCLQVPLVYCDQTASNRPVQSVEEYMSKVCLPLYGNTHTNTSITGCQSTAFVSEARQIVAEACNAKVTGKASQDVVLFA